MASLFSVSIKNLKGIGERRAGLFKKLGVPTVGALLRFYPRAYQDLSHPCTAAGVPNDTVCAVKAKIIERAKETRIRSGMAIYKAKADDGENYIELTFFNNPYIVNLLKPGEEYIFYGKVAHSGKKYEMTAPEFILAAVCPPVRPIYRQTQGLSSRMIGEAVKSALLLLPDVMRDPIPQNIRMEYSLCQLRFALLNIHFPADMQSLELARKRLIFEEFLVLQLGLFLMKGHNRGKSSFLINGDRTEEFYGLLPFKPTVAQKRAVGEGLSDMMSGYAMNRLIQGDVGSGKTAVAQALCYFAVKSGMQAAMMAPTEILARQHYNSFSELFAPAGIRIELLTGSANTAKKRSVLNGLADGEIDLIIGTHALLSNGVKFKNLGLVITDEQHRFGVAQRAALSAKGENPHMLVMSATPIPRTLALMIYGDLDLSVLDELPPGRLKTATYAVTPDKRRRAFAFVKKQLDSGRQCYIICPMIDEGQNDMVSVEKYARELKKSDWLPGYSIETLHGRMKTNEKEDVMDRFSRGEIDVLVSTTVVEVGVDVPNATIMIIENAERYGLSQLHQLRGRIGRGKMQSYCILISGAQNGEITARLKIMCRTNDGFKIADEDLKLRGPGDFFGQRQHGLPDLKIADMTADMDIFKTAQASARAIIKRDPTLSAPECRGLRAEVKLLFSHMEIS